MRQLDKTLVEIYKIDLLQIMENAGRGLAIQSRSYLGGTVFDKKIIVLVGKGNDGGGGLVAARNLHNWGAQVKVIISSPRNELSPVAAKQLNIVDSMKIPTEIREDPLQDKRIDSGDLILDCLLGYNQKGNPRAEVARLVELANDSNISIIALDIPTGLDPDSGNPNHPCIMAKQTLTLAVVKTGLYSAKAKPFVGELYLADISVPLEIGRAHV